VDAKQLRLATAIPCSILATFSLALLIVMHNTVTLTVFETGLWEGNGEEAPTDLPRSATLTVCGERIAKVEGRGATVLSFCQQVLYAYVLTAFSVGVVLSITEWSAYHRL